MISIVQIQPENPVILTVASWLFNQWGRLKPDNTIEKTVARLKNPEEVYVTLVAFNEAGIPIGTASIIKHDMKERPELTPWLAAVLVLPEYRGKSVASQLCNRSKLELARLGFKKAYLYTDTAASLYSRLGWRTASVEEYNGQTVTIMDLDIVEPLALNLPPLIRTPRLLVRKPHVGDGPQLREAIDESFKELHTWMAWADRKLSPEEAYSNVSTAVELWDSRKELRLPFFGLDGKVMMGSTGITPLNWKLRSFEIGYWIRPRFSGQGYVTEAANAATQYAFKILNARRVEVRCDEDNARSRKIIERLGFALEGKLLNQDLKPFTDIPRNTLVYGRIDLSGLPDLAMQW